MISEIFPLKVRSAAISVSTVANWAANFLVGTFFLTLTGAISIEGTFWLYAVRRRRDRLLRPAPATDEAVGSA
jgi:hypothetical protein